MALVRGGDWDAPEAESDRDRADECRDWAITLETGDPAARRWAARDLAECENTSQALVDRLRREPESSVREVLITALTKQGDGPAIEGLVECLRSEDPALRGEAIEAMKLLPGPVAPVMESLLTDPDPDIRILAVSILESLRHPSVEAWLITVVETDPHVNVCGAAADLLTEIGTRRAVPGLLRLKERFESEPYIQYTADLALQRIGES